jgi:hypothetical protein
VEEVVLLISSSPGRCCCCCCLGIHDCRVHVVVDPSFSCAALSSGRPVSGA